MAPRPDEADLTVGIDFGMTCTGERFTPREIEYLQTDKSQQAWLSPKSTKKAPA